MKRLIAKPASKAASADVSRKGRVALQRRASNGRGKALRYDARDIEEANRIGAAICRQHAR